MLRGWLRWIFRASRAIIRRAGYDIVRFPASTVDRAESPEIFEKATAEKAIVIPARCLRSFSGSVGVSVERVYDLIGRRVAGLPRTVDFPILGAGRRSDSLHKRIFGYINRPRVRGYLDIVTWLDRIGAIASGARVIDMGTGVGVLPFIVKERWPEADVHGADANQDYIDLASALFPEIPFEKRVLQDGSGVYDVVILTEVLEHLVDPRAALWQLSHLLTEHGRLILTVPDGRWDHMESYTLIAEAGSYGGHINFWSVESFFYLLEQEFPDARILIACADRQTLYACVEFGAAADFSH